MFAAFLAAALIQFSGTTAQHLPLRFTLQNASVTNFRIAARPPCGRLPPTYTTAAFPPMRVRARRFYGVARDVPARIAPQYGQLAYLEGHLVSRRRATGIVRVRVRQTDPERGIISCTGFFRWEAVAR